MQLGSAAPLKIECFTAEFFTAPPKKLRVADEGTGRTYFLFKDRIVAVAIEERPQ